MHDNSISGDVRRQWLPLMMLSLLCCLILAPVAAVRAQMAAADSVVSADAELRSQRVTTWTEGGSRFLLMERDVTVAVGTYGFRSDRAVVRIDNEISGMGKVYHLAMYLDNARALPGRGPTSAEAKRLLVTVSTTGQLDLVTDLIQEGSAGTDPLVGEANDRINEYLNAVAAKTAGPLKVRMAEGSRVEPAKIEKLPRGMRHKVEGLDIPVVHRGDEVEAEGEVASTQKGDTVTKSETEEETEVAATPLSNVLPTTGVVSFRADKPVIRGLQRGVGENKERQIVLIGHVRVVYQSADEPGQGMSLSADNAVIFVGGQGPTEITENSALAKDVTGVYLEGNVVAPNGDYTIRSPRVFYDVAGNKAVVLDAVMYTWDVKKEVPIYVRAEKLMQHSRTTFGAERATLTTSEFAKPHFAIGARQVTVRQTTRADGTVRQQFTARDNVAKIGSLPIFYWPAVTGDVQDFPVREFDVTYNESTGPTVRTAWDIYALMNKEKPEGVDLLGRIDYLGDHGPGVGLNLKYDRGETFGKLDAYALLLDHGNDEIGGRSVDIEHDGDTRGYALWQHRTMMDDIEVSVEAAYVSDPSFLEEFYRKEAEESKQYETSLFLKKQNNDEIMSLLFKYDVNDFVTQTTTYQTSGHPTAEGPGPGYTVDKLPELTYQRIGTTLWDNRLTYFGSAQASQMRIHRPRDTPHDRGFSTDESGHLFGIDNHFRLGDVIDDTFGADMGTITRFDTRHEVEMPMKFSIVDVVPYIAGRATVYSDDTRDINDSGSPDNPENTRLWGAVGTRFHTEFSRSYDRISSKLFDLHRLRHIIEPSMDVFAMGSNTEAEDYAVFDYDVETLNTGLGVKLGLLNTLQTQRGGQGRWRTVDWLVLQTDLVLRDKEEEPALGLREVFPRYYSSRPENSFGGDMFYNRLMWMISDTLAMVGDTTYDLDDSEMDEWRIGLNLQHSPLLGIYADYTDITDFDARLLRWGFDYRLTTKYTLGFQHNTNLAATNDRSMQLTLTRDMPRWKLILVADIDELENDQTIGVLFVPEGLAGSRYNRPTFNSRYFN